MSTSIDIGVCVYDSMTQYNTTQHNTSQHNTTQHSTALHLSYLLYYSGPSMPWRLCASWAIGCANWTHDLLYIYFYVSTKYFVLVDIQFIAIQIIVWLAFNSLPFK